MSSSSPRGPSAVCAIDGALVWAPNQASATGRPSGTSASTSGIAVVEPQA